LASFEESLSKLEEVVGQLERGDLSLDEAVRLFEEGSRLSADCRRQLEEAEGRVEVLIKQRDGAMKREPFGESQRSPGNGSQE
jgi:exodeoxyribonuclease VII small subunit